MIRPYLKKKYANLCNIHTLITSFLFGDDVQREIKKCDTSMSVTREQYNFYPQRLFVCVEVLRPSQPNGVMSSAVSLPNHTFSGQA